jgi:hypothetical protein
MLAISDLPAGFVPDAPMTGSLDASRAEKLGGGLAAQAAGLVHGWVKWWVSGQTRAPGRVQLLDSSH